MLCIIRSKVHGTGLRAHSPQSNCSWAIAMGFLYSSRGGGRLPGSLSIDKSTNINTMEEKQIISMPSLHLILHQFHVQITITTICEKIFSSHWTHLRGQLLSWSLSSSWLPSSLLGTSHSVTAMKKKLVWRRHTKMNIGKEKKNYLCSNYSIEQGLTAANKWFRVCSRKHAWVKFVQAYTI